MGTSAGDVTAALDVGDVAITTYVGNVGMEISDGDVTAVADVNEVMSDVCDVAVTTGVGEEGWGRAMVTRR